MTGSTILGSIWLASVAALSFLIAVAPTGRSWEVAQFVAAGFVAILGIAIAARAVRSKRVGKQRS